MLQIKTNYSISVLSICSLFVRNLHQRQKSDFGLSKILKGDWDLSEFSLRDIFFFGKVRSVGLDGGNLCLCLLLRESGVGRAGWRHAMSCHQEIKPTWARLARSQQLGGANMAARPTTSRRRVGDSGKDTAAIEVLHRKDENLRSGCHH